ncbi:hypothetical protein GIB67_042090 [Kingdonia uniflora]|uniref:Cation efflux protein cytoplasmic domain-containing protein n=1 Tax=Kingdonia uniflora TaxID=39325 RepID=A0A7J7MVP5_9MAGN|nr:hypothetical protein GIB67_042090 [Kingdonia uniflora]
MAVLLGHDHGHNHESPGHDHGHGSHSHGDHDHGLSHGNRITITCHEHNGAHSKHSKEHEHDHSEPLLEKFSKDLKKRQNVNIQGAYHHVLGDSIQSIGVMIRGAIIWMLRNILEVLMDSTPREIDATMLEKGLYEIEEVVAIHEFHIWAITIGKVLLACHVKIHQGADADIVLDKVVDYIQRVYNISHAEERGVTDEEIGRVEVYIPAHTKKDKTIQYPNVIVKIWQREERWNWGMGAGISLSLVEKVGHIVNENEELRYNNNELKFATKKLRKYLDALTKYVGNIPVSYVLF